MSLHIPPTKSRFLFVSGPPRAGTTLLRLVLSAHPMITITPETRFIGQMFNKKYPPYKRLTLDEQVAITELMKSDAKLNSWPAFSLDEFINAHLTRHRNTIRQLLKQLFLCFATKTGGGTQYLGNKKDLYATGYGPYTKKVFPHAKFIYIVRDPRDTVRSMSRAFRQYTFSRNVTLCSICGQQIRLMKDLFPDDVLIVKYEDLVAKPQEICRLMCRFLDIPFDEQMPTFYKTNPEASRLMTLTKHIHENTTRPFNVELIGQWKNDKNLTKNAIRIIEAVNREYMEIYGYEPETRPSWPTTDLMRLKMYLETWQFRRNANKHSKRFI